MSRARRRSRQKNTTAGWIWMLGGFSLGVVVAAAVYVYSAQLIELPVRPGAPAPRPVAADTPVVAQPQPSAREAETLTTSDDETEFEFYDVLPEFELVVPETAETLRRDARAESIERSGNYIIQVGSFRTVADADRMQARIALLGIESHIQRVAIDDDVYHRVRVGPVTELAELNRVRRQLREERIDYLLTEARD